MTKYFLVILVIITSACSTMIQSNKSKAYSDKIENLYVVILVAENTEKFAEKFETVLTELMSEKGVDITFEKYHPLSLENDEDLMARVKKSGANTLMYISQIQSTTYTQANTIYLSKQKASSGIFDFKIFEPNNDSPIWRAQLKSSNKSGYGNIGSLAKASAEKLMQQLIADEML